MKTKKAFLKRIKITGSGKVMKRPPSQNHFNARENGQQTRSKRGDVRAPREMNKMIKALISKY